MGDRLKGKVAVVTGAGRGIGRAEAIALASEGASIVVNDLGTSENGSGSSQRPADEVCSEITKLGGQAAPSYNSVASFKGAQKIVQTAIDQFGKIDILINNAGILRDRMVFNMSEEEWDVVMKVHLYGTFYCTRAASVFMRQQRWGRIVNTSSISGLGSMGQANYSAAKEGIIGFTRTVAQDMAKYGVTCNAIRPMASTRFTVSPDLKASMAKKLANAGVTDEAEINKIFDQMFSSKPEQVAAFVLYLATNEAAYINGRTFFINGNHIGLYTDPRITSQINKDQGLWSLDEFIKMVPLELCTNTAGTSPLKIIG
ncbi:MAG: SDR family NAD(P)-dependent oxidoreductase [Dehalococcoidia bacterium]|nr:SDR family NAD(P)-dependent oxidoreductase [Dehalococcoidia bacterium]